VDPVTTGPCPGDGLVITGEGVSLDLGWATIQGSLAVDSVGIRVVAPPDRFSALIRNGTIAEFGRGLIGGEGVSVKRMNVSRNAGAGIALMQFTGEVSVRTSVARANGGVGIEVWCGEIRNSNAEQNGSIGIISFNPGCSGLVYRAVSRENGDAGFRVRGEGGRIERSLAVRNVSHGYVFASGDLTATKLQAVQNGGHGFAIDSENSRSDQLRTKGNRGFGIHANSPGLFFNSYGPGNYCQGDALGDSNRPGLCK
jgi:hypothetical protein